MYEVPLVLLRNICTLYVCEEVDEGESRYVKLSKNLVYWLPDVFCSLCENPLSERPVDEPIIVLPLTSLNLTFTPVSVIPTATDKETKILLLVLDGVMVTDKPMSV